MLAVPDRLEQRVGEAEDLPEVLDGLLAEVVVDAEDLRLRERLRDDAPFSSIELGRLSPNGFSDDDARPRSAAPPPWPVGDEPVVLELLDDGPELRGRKRRGQ